MRTFITLLTGTVALLATTAMATDLACIDSAHGAFVACKTDCKTDFTDAKAACKNVTPGCLSDCNAQRSDCFAAAQAPLDDCIAQNGCAGIVGAYGDGGGRDICKARVGCGGAGHSCAFNPAFITCLDPYEQLAFACRDSCRNSWQLSGGPGDVAACRTAHRACVQACPPAN